MHMRPVVAALAALSVVAAVVTARAAGPAPATGGPSEVAPSLLARAAAGEAELDCIVALRQAKATFHGAVESDEMFVARATAVLEATWGPLGAEVTRRYSSLPLVALHVPAAHLAELASDPLVAGVWPNRTAHSFRKEGKALMNVAAVTGRGFDGRGVGIAILDTGVDYGHTELSPGGTDPSAKTIKLFDAIDNDGDPRDEQGHGTSVAGIAAGKSGGMAPSAWIVAVRVLDDQGEGSDAQILAGIDAVLASVRTGDPYNIRVLNMSLGGYDDTDWPPGPGHCDSIAGAYTAAFRALVDANILPVVAAGNGGCSRGIAWPACISTALAVGAVYDDEICALPVPPFGCLSSNMSFGESQCIHNGCSDNTKADRITCYSDSSEALDVLAPSHCAKTPKKGGGNEDCFGGTSAAAPYASGVVALLAQAFPARSCEAIRAALVNTGRARPDGRNNITRNRIDAGAAYTYLATHCDAPAQPTGLAGAFASACAGAAFAVHWTAVPGAATYTVQAAATPDFASPVESSATSPFASVIPADGGGTMLYVRVRAVADCAAASPWSSTLATPVRDDCAGPPRPRLHRP